MGRGPWLLGAGVVLVSLQLSREGCPQLVTPAVGVSGVVRVPTEHCASLPKRTARIRGGRMDLPMPRLEGRT